MSPSEPNKKTPNQEPSGENPFGSAEIQKKRADAAMEFLQIFQEKLPLVDGRPHAGTVLSAAGRLAGTSLFRAIHKKEFKPGTVVLSEEANQSYPQLLNLFAYYVKQSGLDVMSRPLVTQFPEADKPRMELAEVQAEYQDQYNEVMKKHGLDHLDGARAGMIVCSMVFQYHCMKAGDLDPFVGTGLVAMGVVEGAKTAPPPQGTKPAARRKRFLLGELDAVIQEARANGGGYVEINPEIMKMLKDNKLDPFLVYEKALLNQMEQQVDRFDLVQMDADAVAAEWIDKPSELAPIPVRLVLWMKQNAASHGYEQKGNSWFLKG